MEGDYTLYVYRIGDESKNSRYKCLAEFQSNSQGLHFVQNYFNLSQDQLTKAEHIVENFKGKESKLLTKLDKIPLK